MRGWQIVRTCHVPSSIFLHRSSAGTQRRTTAGAVAVAGAAHRSKDFRAADATPTRQTRHGRSVRRSCGRWQKASQLSEARSETAPTVLMTLEGLDVEVDASFDCKLALRAGDGHACRNRTCCACGQGASMSAVADAMQVAKYTPVPTSRPVSAHRKCRMSFRHGVERVAVAVAVAVAAHGR